VIKYFITTAPDTPPELEELYRQNNITTTEKAEN
jgi:hypothetical protein